MNIQPPAHAMGASVYVFDELDRKPRYGSRGVPPGEDTI